MSSMDDRAAKIEETLSEYAITYTTSRNSFGSRDLLQMGLECMRERWLR